MARFEKSCSSKVEGGRDQISVPTPRVFKRTMSDL